LARDGGGGGRSAIAPSCCSIASRGAAAGAIITSVKGLRIAVAAGLCLPLPPAGN
jgi:hypothetical protein